MAMLSNLDLIRRVPIFSLLTNDQAQGIADSVVKRRYRRGEIIVEHGRKSNALFILLTGRARVLTADHRGREVIMAVVANELHNPLAPIRLGVGLRTGASVGYLHYRPKKSYNPL